ncbi:hypothetical protein ACFSJ3_17740 [Corallincola platygyrae]|uniref:Uncharacterized protein n=1 Tax=Corallincola platygyrae TaxID=1193278 RepID=A0ABW4XQM5_9GAMM
MSGNRYRVLYAATVLFLGAFGMGAYTGFSSAPCGNANYLWCSDFESGLKGWHRGINDPNVKLIHFPGPMGAHQQNTVMQLRLPPGKGGTGVTRLLPSSYNKLFLRWNQLFEAGFDFHANYHGQGLQAINQKGKAGFRPKGDDWFSVKLDHTIHPQTEHPSPYLYAYFPGMNMDCKDPHGRCWGEHLPCFISQKRYCRDPNFHPAYSLPELRQQHWYCIEIMVDMGSPTPTAEGADGMLSLTIDDKLIGNWSDLWLRSDGGLKLNRIVMGLYHHEEHSEAGVLIDDVVISRQPIGCLQK